MKPLRVECIIGPTGAGKTTLCRALEKAGSFAVYPGQLCREAFGESAMANATRSDTPEFTENFVREAVELAISNNVNVDTVLYVDSFPKSVEQLQWLHNLCSGLMVGLSAIYLTVDPAVRMARVLERDKDNEGKLKLTARRLVEEEPQLQKVVSALVGGRIPLRYERE